MNQSEITPQDANDNDPADDDPMTRLVDNLKNRDKSAADVERKKREAEKAAAEQRLAELSLKKAEIEEKRRAQQFREQQAEEKRRDEQMKQFAKAAKTASELKGREEAALTAEEDTIPARIEALRKIGLMQQLMKTPGTGRPCTRNTPLNMLLAELDVMDQQANLERASGTPETAALVALEAGENALAPVYDCRGLASDFKRALEASKRSNDPVDKQLELAMLHCSIKYSSWFAVKPETYLILTVAQMARARHAYNMALAEEAGGRPLTDEVAEEYERRFKEQQQATGLP